MVVAYMILVSARTKSLPVKREGSWTWTRTWQYVLLYYIIIVYLFLLRIAPFFSFDQSHWLEKLRLVKYFTELHIL